LAEQVAETRKVKHLHLSKPVAVVALVEWVAALAEQEAQDMVENVFKHIRLYFIIK